MTMLQDIPTFDGQDSSKLEDWFIDTETTANILTVSDTCLAEVICMLNCKVTICQLEIYYSPIYINARDDAAHRQTAVPHYDAPSAFSPHA